MPAAYSWRGCRGIAGHLPRRTVRGERGTAARPLGAHGPHLDKPLDTGGERLVWSFDDVMDVRVPFRKAVDVDEQVEHFRRGRGQLHSFGAVNFGEQRRGLLRAGRSVSPAVRASACLQGLQRLHRRGHVFLGDAKLVAVDG